MKLNKGQSVFLIFFIIISIFVSRYYAERTSPIPDSYHQKVMAALEKEMAEGKYNDTLEVCKQTANNLKFSSDVIIWYDNTGTGEYYCGLITLDNLTVERATELKPHITILNSSKVLMPHPDMPFNVSPLPR